MNLTLARRLRIAGILVLIGLLIELISLQWSHPTAFLFFVIFGGIFFLFGILFYLYSLVPRGEKVIDVDKPVTHEGAMK